MKKITLVRRPSSVQPINAAGLKLDLLIQLNADEIARIDLNPIGGLAAASEQASDEILVGDVFEISVQADESYPDGLLHFVGDCGNVHAIGFQHRRGQIRIEGNIGDHAAACMTGGEITIDGNAGDYLGAPLGSRGVGMNGGTLCVTGDVGDFAGHRMRCGEMWVGGNAGDALASWQVAGTIGVAGKVGRHVAYGMRRGTLILAKSVPLSNESFTEPIRLRTPFADLLSIRNQTKGASYETCFDVGGDWHVRRGDRTIGGIGELWIR